MGSEKAGDMLGDIPGWVLDRIAVLLAEDTQRVERIEAMAVVSIFLGVDPTPPASFTRIMRGSES